MINDVRFSQRPDLSFSEVVCALSAKLSSLTHVTCRSSLEDGWEAGLQVAHVGLHRWSRSRLGHAHGLELGLIILFLRLALDKLQRVLLVVWEGSQTLVVADLGRLCWSEGLVVFHQRSGGRRCLPVWVVSVLTDHCSVSVEKVSLLNLLREWLVLLEFLAGQTRLSS